MAKKDPPQSPREVAEQAAKQEAHKVFQAEFRAVHHRGPLPSPEVMERYEALHPGATKFFFSQLEKQTEHRQSLERTVVTSRERRANAGQWLAFILFFLIIAGGFTALFVGYQAVGLITALAGVAGPLSLFFWRRKQTDAELAEKST